MSIPRGRDLGFHYSQYELPVMTREVRRIAARSGKGSSVAPQAAAFSPCWISSCVICSRMERLRRSAAGKRSR